MELIDKIKAKAAEHGLYLYTYGTMRNTGKTTTYALHRGENRPRTSAKCNGMKAYVKGKEPHSIALKSTLKLFESLEYLVLDE